MNTLNNKLYEKVKTIIWAFKLAWKIDKKMMLLWFFISALLSVLPAVALYYYQNIIAVLSAFLMTGTGQFSDVVTSIVVLGVILSAVGLSGRINGELLFLIMYDSYYIGMEKVIVDHVQKFDMKDFLNKDFYEEYYAVINRSGSLTGFMSSLCTLFSKLVSISSLLIIAFRESKVIFIITLIYVVAALWVNTSFLENTRYNMIKSRESEAVAEIFKKMPLTPGIAKELRLYGTKDEMLSQWNSAYKGITDDENKRNFGLELRTFISGAGFYVFMIGIIVYAVFEVGNRKMGADVFLTIYTMCQSIATAISGVAGGFLSMDYNLFSLERQHSFIGRVPDKNLHDDAARLSGHDDHPVIFEAKNMSFGYEANVPVLKDLSFKIKKGEVIALVGLNGSGKSTLVKLLLQLYEPTEGKLYFYGKPFTAYRRGYINSNIGAFFQKIYLFHVKLSENIGFGDVEHVNDDKRIHLALKKGGAEKVADKLPKGLNNMIGREVDTEGAVLSGGEKQRVAAARAHMSDKEIMIFDEPASALDPIAELEQFMAIKEKVQGRTAVLISHRVGFARLADRIIVLDKGRIAESGSHEQLLQEDGIYANFFNQQAKWYDTSAEGSYE